MAETENISKVADIMSKDIFKWFKWNRQKVRNENWQCVQHNKHGVKTHPSDIIFYYTHPYNGNRIYLNTDLKSYAKNSIKPDKTEDALVSLGKTVDCANLSPGWKELFLDDGVQSYHVHGLLFIYNHDGEYDKNFQSSHIKKVDFTKIKIAPNNRIHVLGPDKIRILHSIATDISKCKSEEVFNSMSDFSFFYPDMIMSKVDAANKWNQAAIIELFTSGWIIMNYKSATGEGYVVYYLRNGDTVEEFEYLIDYLSHYQLLLSNSPITVKFVDSSKMAPVNLERAVKKYSEVWGNIENKTSRLKDIKYESITQYATSFSTIEIGMDYE